MVSRFGFIMFSLLPVSRLFLLMHNGHLNFFYKLPTEDLSAMESKWKVLCRGERHDLTTLQVENKLEATRVTVKRSVKRLVQ